MRGPKGFRDLAALRAGAGRCRREGWPGGAAVGSSSGTMGGMSLRNLRQTKRSMLTVVLWPHSGQMMRSSGRSWSAAARWYMHSEQSMPRAAWTARRARLKRTARAQIIAMVMTRTAMSAEPSSGWLSLTRSTSPADPAIIDMATGGAIINVHRPAHPSTMYAVRLMRRGARKRFCPVWYFARNEHP